MSEDSIKSRFFHQTGHYNDKIIYLLRALGFKNLLTGQNYLKKLFPDYLPETDNDSGLIKTITGFLSHEIIQKNHVINTTEQKEPKKKKEFTVSDLIDYVFCPQRTGLKFQGFTLAQAKQAKTGEKLHARDLLSLHINLARNHRPNLWRRVFSKKSIKFSTEYHAFLKKYLTNSTPLYHPKKDNRLLRWQNIRGKPDYIFRGPEENIIVELKYSQNNDDFFYNTYKIQLYSYALLAHTSGIETTKAFLIKYSPQSGPDIQPAIYWLDINIREAENQTKAVINSLGRAMDFPEIMFEPDVDLNKCCRCSYRYLCRYPWKA